MNVIQFWLLWCINTYIYHHSTLHYNITKKDNAIYWDINIWYIAYITGGLVYLVEAEYDLSTQALDELVTLLLFVNVGRYYLYHQTVSIIALKYTIKCVWLIIFS